MEKPNFDNLTPEQARYLELLEGQVNGASNLIKELNLISEGYAQDLMKIRTGQAGEEGKNLNYIKPDKNDTIFARTMVLVDKIDKILAIEKATKQVEPEVKEAKETKKPAEPVKRKNFQDIVLNGHE